MKKSKVVLKMVQDLEASNGGMLKVPEDDPELKQIRNMFPDVRESRSIFHKKIDKAIYDDWQRGRTIDWLAYDYGKSHKAIVTSIDREIRWNQRNRNKKPKFSDSISEEQLGIMKYQYTAGLPIRNLARMFRTSDYQIKNVIDKYGLERNPQSL